MSRKQPQRNSALERFRQQVLHGRDSAQVRKWNQPNPNQPRPKPPGTGTSSRSARKRRRREKRSQVS